MTIPLGCLSPSTSRDRPGRRSGNRLLHPKMPRAVPIWSCSRWGLPCQPRCRVCGGLLPHPFTLAAGRSPVGGMLSVALSLGLPPPGVTRHLYFRWSPDFPRRLAPPRPSDRLAPPRCADPAGPSTGGLAARAVDAGEVGADQRGDIARSRHALMTGTAVGK